MKNCSVGRHCLSVQGWIACSRLFIAMSCQFFNISKAVNPTACSVFGHPYNKQGFLVVQGNFLFSLLFSLPVSEHHGEEPGSVFIPAIRYLYIIYLYIIPFSLNPHSAPSPSWRDMLQSLGCPVALPGLSLVPCLSCSGEPRTGHCTLSVVQNRFYFKAISSAL